MRDQREPLLSAINLVEVNLLQFWQFVENVSCLIM